MSFKYVRRRNVPQSTPGVIVPPLGVMVTRATGDTVNSTLSLAAIDCHPSGIYTVILLPLLSLTP